MEVVEVVVLSGRPGRRLYSVLGSLSADSQGPSILGSPGPEKT